MFTLTVADVEGVEQSVTDNDFSVLLALGKPYMYWTIQNQQGIVIAEDTNVFTVGSNGHNDKQ